MKKEKGITLIALIIYIIMFSATIGLLASLSNYIFNNLSNINSNSIIWNINSSVSNTSQNKLSKDFNMLEVI